MAKIQTINNDITDIVFDITKINFYNFESYLSGIQFNK